MSEWDIYQYLCDNPNLALNCEELQKRIKTPRIPYKVRQLLQKKYIKSIQGAIDKKRRNVRETWYFIGQPEHIFPAPKVILK